MKKLLLTLFLLISAFSFSQTSDFDKKWILIDSLEINGQVETADKVVSEIIKSAFRKKDYPQLIKAKIYHYKFYQINHENSNQYILQDLNQLISRIPGPYQNLALSYKAGFLYQYFQDNRWTIKQRQEISNPDENIETWSINTLQDSIKSSYNKSLENEKKLISLPVGDIAELLDETPLNRKYRPTLFDLLAQRALEYYSNSGNFGEVKPDQEYPFDNQQLYATTQSFVELKFPAEVLGPPEVKALKLYQKLETLHSEDKNPEAKVFAQLNRLDYVNTYYSENVKWEHYTTALDKLSEEYKTETINALILYTLAESFYNRAGEIDENGKLLHPDFLIKAFTLSEEVSIKYPNTDTAQQALRLIRSIKQVQLDAKIPTHSIPDSPGRMFVSYKSLDSLHLKIFRVPESFSRKLNYRNRDSVIGRHVERKPLFSKVVYLPESEDYNFHSTEVLLPKLGIGTYLVYISDTDKAKKKGYSYGFLQATNLVVTKTDFERLGVYQSLDRQDGDKIGSVKVEFFNNEGHVSQEKFTDANGQLKETKSRNNSRSSLIRASKAGDTLSTQYWPGYYYNNGEEREDYPLAKSLLYLDRAIYRPGQKVYFKGVLLKYEKNKTQTVPNEFVEVYVDDPNGEEIQQFRLKTNKYGSFHGEFILPKTGMTGEFEIYTEEDIDSETPFWNKIWDDGEYLYENLSFKVEEYKRPTFEVTFDTINRSFEFGDSIQLEGKANSFMGAGLNNTKVIYEIKRRKLIKHWWYYQYSEPVSIKNDTSRTDSMGNFSIEFPAIVATEDADDKNLIYQYSIQTTVTDLNGETREASTELKIGRKNLLLNISLAANIGIGDSLKADIEATNRNEHLVPVKGSIKIYKLEGPTQILHERLWEAPEINIIEKKKFQELFPHEPYTSKISPENWPKLEMVYESNFENDGILNTNILITKEWESGKYLVEVEVSNQNSTAEASKVFSIIDPDDQYLPDNQPLNISLQNKNFAREGKVKVLIQTAYNNLNLNVAAYDADTKIFDEFVTIDGKKLIEIPLKNLTSRELEIQITGVRNNTEIIENQRVFLSSANKSLQIQTETFRNKIEPGIEETWSFKIINSEDKAPDAEVLASMYDASLDQFTTQDWNTNPNFENSYTQFPNFSISNVGSVENLFNRFNNINSYSSSARVFDRLKFFGFYYSRPNSYQYRRYLNRKKEARDSVELIGNTRGKITDSNGEPLPGVNVILKGTSIGTQTNFDGEFALDTKLGDELVISYVGFANSEYIMGEKKEVYISLEEDASQLEEVVTVGYATQTVAFETAAATDQDPAISQLLQGNVAGVTITEAGGAGSASVIKIRGASSISAENAPLYIIDGVPVSDVGLSLAPSDILSVEMLKGDEATALYGVKAKYGVVIITSKKGLEDLKNVEARKNLDETAFFFPNLKLDSNGKLNFTFTSPEALTQWKLRLLAHTKDWTTRQYENNIITQKELSITPNPPRFFREGDTIIFTSKISNLSGKSMTGKAVLQVFDALSMQPIDSLLGNIETVKSFKMTASNSTSVSWRLVIPQSVQAVTYRILAKAGNFSDGEENILPVLPNRMLVKESLPIFVRAGETKAYEFKSLKENDSKTLENHQFSLEYSSNPAWYAIQSLPYLMEFEHECSEQIFARLFANSLGSKIVNSKPIIKEVFEKWQKDSSLVSQLEKNEDLKSLILAETPWLRDAQSESLQKKQIANLFDSEKLAEEQNENLKRLARMQNPSGAFPWFSGGRDNYFITRHILAGLGKLKHLDVQLKDQNITKNAITYLDEQLLKTEKINQSRNDDLEYFYNNISNLHYLYARSFYLEDFPFSIKIRNLADKIIEIQKENWLEKSLYQKGLLMLVLSKMQDKNFARQILTSLKETAVKSEDYGMYWKENEASWFWYQAPIETQALLIEAFSELGNEEDAIEEMSIWLLQNKRTKHWPTTKSTTEACYALLMQNNKWVDISNNTNLKIGGKNIKPEKLAETTEEAGTGYLKLNWKGEEINENFGNIEVENNNNTAGYGGAYWQYFEDLDKIEKHSQSPLNVDKELYLNVSTDSGIQLKQITPKTPLKIGDLVTVRLVVSSTTDMDFIHLKDMRASGFEPTNVLSEYKYQDGTAYYESTRDAATHFFFDSLRKGTYVLEYTVRANNPGDFSNEITTIENMYAPEFSSHTKGIRVNIEK